jgi:hypothetical protein
MRHDLDPYRTLQVDPTAEEIVIQAAYRALMKRHHPDRGGDDAVARRLNAAWALIGDARARHAYDLRRARADAAGTRSTAHAEARPEAPAPPARFLGAELGSELLRRFTPILDKGPGWLFDFAGGLKRAPRHRIWMKRFHHGDLADARAFLVMIEATRLSRPLWLLGSDLFVAVASASPQCFEAVLRAPRGPFPGLGYGVAALDLSARVVRTVGRGRRLRTAAALAEAVAAAR